MAETKYSPYFAFSFLLTLLVTGSLVIQSVGHFLDISLASVALLIAFLPSLFFTYHYFFPADRRHMTVAIALAFFLTALGYASRYILDFSPDGLGYQQAPVEHIMDGWNPFGPTASMLWEYLYPSGAWAVEASLAFLYGSIEAGKSLQIWWLFIAAPVLLAGLSCVKNSGSRRQMAMVALIVFSPVVLSQVLTHYVDSLLYLSSLTFLGALLTYGYSRRENMRAGVLMVCCSLFIVNVKLTGIYHGFTLGLIAILFLWLRTKIFPWKITALLLTAGLAATLVIGHRPYVTSFVRYGISLFPLKSETFSGAQRPSSFDGKSGPERFLGSLFSTTGGEPHQPVQYKWPWMVQAPEWKFSGDPDPRSGGFGPLFALGFVLSLALFIFALLSGQIFDKSLILLAGLCLLFSALFPQSWWLRYVPLAYAVPFFLLLAISTGGRAAAVILLIFAINSALSASSMFVQFKYSQRHFTELANQLHQLPAGTVYLVPPVKNYQRYNCAHLPLQRRLRQLGVVTFVRPDSFCSHRAEVYAEFSICY